MGVSIIPPMIVSEYCARGSLFDVLRAAASGRSPELLKELTWHRRLSLVGGNSCSWHCPTAPAFCCSQLKPGREHTCMLRLGGDREKTVGSAALQLPSRGAAMPASAEVLGAADSVGGCPAGTRLSCPCLQAIDAARGLLYLHSYKPQIVHRDFKSLNCLVDANWNAKVDGLVQRRRHAGALPGSQLVSCGASGPHTNVCPPLGRPFAYYGCLMSSSPVATAPGLRLQPE